jgi:gliding motility-associated-like protein
VGLSCGMIAKGLPAFLLSVIYSICFCAPQPGIKFIQNKNQWPSSIDFKATIPGGTVELQAAGFSYTFLDFEKIEELHDVSHHAFQEVKSISEKPEMINAVSLKAEFLGANKNSKAVTFGMSSEDYNFFLGNNRSKWASGAKAFDGIIYQSLYEGIDLKIYSQGENLKYDFIVAPGSDPSIIRIAYSGMKEISIERGDIIVKTLLGDVIEKKPVAFQYINGQRRLVLCEFSVKENEIIFTFPNGYDACEELVIDPLLIFSTYSGSKADSWGSTATPGEKGNLYSAGVTTRLFSVNGANQFSDDFPTTPGAFQVAYGGLYDVGILKYDSLGQKLLYASYLGGSANESAHSLVVNAEGDLIVLGTTSSSNFPTSEGAFDKSFNGGTFQSNVVTYNNGSDIFIARISKTGNALIASTFLGGTANDGLNPDTSPLSVNYGDELRGDVITDSEGNIYVSSVTSSTNFPVSNSFGLTYKGGLTDAIIFKINPSLSSIVWATFLGGSSSDATHTIKFDKAGNLFVAGGTSSINFPVTTGVYQSVYKGGVDGWISNISNDGSSILASTYTGTSAFNQIYFVDLNKQDEVYVYGQTTGTFPVTDGTYRNANSGQFIQKFNHSLKNLIFSTVVGSGRGLPDISPTAFLVNDCNNIYITGWGGRVNQAENWNNNTIGMPVSNDAFQKTTSGSDFYFMVLTDDATQFLYGTYMGGTNSRTHVDGGTSRFDKQGVVYHAVCSGCKAYNALNVPTSDFPTTVGAWSRTNNSANCNNAAFKFDLSSLRARIQTNSVNLKSPGVNVVCLPDKFVFQNRSTGGEIYQWDLGDGTKTILADTARIIHQYADVGKYTVKLKAIDVGTCIGKDSTAVTVNVFKALGKVNDSEKICYESSIQLIASGGISYTWEGIKNDFKSNIATPVVRPLEKTEYKISITDFQGCVLKDTVVVDVVPGIDLQSDVQQIFNCNERPKVRVKNSSDEAELTFWDFGDGSISDLREESHSFAEDGIYSIRLIGKKEFCFYEKEIPLPFFTFFAPNVITPDNAEGKNDSFKVLYGGKTPAEQNVNVSLVVYNRWGKVVYESDDYSNDWSGSGLAAGVYYYDATVEGNATCQGWVQIIR